MAKHRCFNCMKIFEYSDSICPHCGHINKKETKEVYHLAPGTILAGKYELGVVIGYGGFGVVYKAWDNNLNQVVAIKEYYPTAFLYREAGNKKAVVFDKKNITLFNNGKEEFLEEARNVARFNQHPNIVHVFDFFEENGTAYFVMEYLDGDSLKKPIRDAKKEGRGIEHKVAVSITLAVLNALKGIHEAGIIHRDIKPGNIFLLKNGTVKVFDLGAARFSDNDTEKTRTIIITPGYAPPEQYQGKSKQGPYTDIYAVGALLYEMLTGIKLEESIERRAHDNTVPPHEINSDIPLSISNAVMRAIAIQPQIRFQNVNEFAQALRKQKEVRSAKQEIKYRKTKRNIKIALILVGILLIGLFCKHQYDKMYTDAELATTSLEVWIVDRDEGLDITENQYREMLQEFIQAYPQVTVTITAIPESQYVEKLVAGLENGNGPDVFESTLLPDTYNNWLEPIDDLLNYSNFDASQYYFLDRYVELFPSKCKLPLTVNIPVRYTNLLDDSLQDGNSYEGYLKGEYNYNGYLSDYSKIQNDMAGIYAINNQFPQGMEGEFEHLWSICSDSKEQEKKAAIRMLYYLLSDNAQEVLTVQDNNGLPLNKNVLEVYVEVNSDFYYVPTILETLQVKGE